MADKSNSHSRCTLMPMIKLEKEIHDDIRHEHIDVLSRTPFGKLFMAFYHQKFTVRDVTKASEDITKVMESYSPDKRAFKLGCSYVKVTVDDFVVTFGLPKQGNLIRPEKRDYSVAQLKSKFVRRKLSGSEKLNKKIIQQAILETVKLSGKQEEEDFARLVILFLLATLFFANSMSTISWSIIDHVEDFEKLNRISWASVFHENLMKNLNNSRKNLVQIPGCVIQLLYWFCEHVDIISPIGRFEADTPRVTRWSLPELTKALKRTSLADLPKEKISKRLKGLSQEEKDLLEGKPCDVDGENFVVKEVLEAKVEESSKEEIRRLRIENEKLKMEVKKLKERLINKEKVVKLQNQNHEAEMKEIEEKVDEVSSLIARIKRKKMVQKEKPKNEHNVQRKKIKVETKEKEDKEQKVTDLGDSEFSDFWYFASTNMQKESVERS